MIEKLMMSRSAFLTYKSCPYKSFLEYFYNGHGVVGTKIPQHFVVGICVHRGMQHLLEHCRQHHPDGSFEEKCIDDAVMHAHQVYSEILSKRELSLRYEEDLSYTVNENYHLIEALIRSYAAARLSDFLSEYEVLEVEKEEVINDFTELCIWLGKADGLLRRRSDNKLVVLSVKCFSSYSEVTNRNRLHDMQGLSEIYAIENRLNKLLAFCYENTYNYIAIQNRTDITPQLLIYLTSLMTNGIREVRCFGNQYEYLIKGQQRKETNTTHYKYATHLLHPVKNDTFANIGTGINLFTTSGGEYEWQIPQGRLPKGKRKIDIYSDIGVKEWINKLAKLEIQPELGNPFANVIIGGEHTLAARDRDEIEEWYISTSYACDNIWRSITDLSMAREAILIASRADDKEAVSNLQKEYAKMLWQYFPRDGKDKQLCYNFYNEQCPFYSHCHEGLDLTDGVDSGMFDTREPHHELELEMFKDRGFLNSNEK